MNMAARVYAHIRSFVLQWCAITFNNVFVIRAAAFYLIRASVVEAEVADCGHLGVQDLLLSFQLLLHLPGLGEGLGHGLVVVQISS